MLNLLIRIIYQSNDVDLEEDINALSTNFLKMCKTLYFPRSI